MSDKDTPLVSVVIPTHKRPHYLPRAIESALLSAPDGNVEVIVVPNGSDTSWKAAQATFAHDARVRWEPVEIAHANVARNHGMSLATGQYIRFLDDDDTLDPTGATHQIEAAVANNAELCSGAINVVDESSAFIRLMKHADRKDLFVAMARSDRVCLPHAHLYQREALGDWQWDESMPVEQDTDWIFRLASNREWCWIVIDEVVGQWTWHQGLRTSRTITQARRASITCNLLLSAMETLAARNALTTDRLDAIAGALWHCAHIQFPSSPIISSRIINRARMMSPGCPPPALFFALPGIRHIHPVLIEWLMIPKRLLNHLLREP